MPNKLLSFSEKKPKNLSHILVETKLYIEYMNKNVKYKKIFN